MCWRDQFGKLCCGGNLHAFQACHGVLWPFVALRHPMPPASMPFFHCAGQSRDTCPLLHLLMLCKEPTIFWRMQISQSMTAWQCVRNTFKSTQVLLDPVSRIMAWEKSLVQPVQLEPGSLLWLRAATAGADSSLGGCAKHARGRRLVLNQNYVPLLTN